ncbi:MAG: BatA domain-containing protein [Planctomycetota bacterium]|jgi:hypothetical protein
MSLVFINAALLAGAGAAVIPLVIHLLHRRKARQDVLSTLRFLKAGLAATRRRTRLKHLLVLLLRITAVLIIVAALARPAYKGALFFRKGTAPVNCVIVLDNSTSMAYVEVAGSRFDRARETACRVARGLPPGSRAGLIVTGVGPRGEVLDREFTFNTAPLCSQMMQLELSACGGTCGDALRRAYAMLETETARETAQGSEVYVISDLAVNAWRTLGGIEPPEGTATFVIDVGGDADANFRIVEATAQRRNAPAPRLEVEAVVMSGRLGASRVAEVYVAGVKRAERIAEVPAGSRVREVFSIPLLENGEKAMQGWVALREDDPVKADNSFYFTARAARRVDCLVVHDEVAGSLDTGLFVRDALEPAGLKGATEVTVTSAAAAQLRREDFAGRDCIVLAGALGVSDDLWREVESFLGQGGGVVLFLAEGLDPPSVSGILGDYLGIEIGGYTREVEGKTLAAIAFEHPALAGFAGGRNGNLAAARFYRRRVLKPVGDRAAAVELARFADGSPALVAGQAGAGRLIVAAFSPVREDTDLVLRASFVPFINELVLHASGASTVGALRTDTRIVGEAVTFEVPRAAEGARAEITTPFGERTVELAAAPGSGRLGFRPCFPGNYLARVSGPHGVSEMPFSVNLDPAESDGDRIAAGEIEDLLTDCVVARELTERRVEEAKGATRGAREIFDFFLVAALAVLALEAYAANRFYREGGRDR